jgi:hypothetical protein
VWDNLRTVGHKRQMVSCDGYLVNCSTHAMSGNRRMEDDSVRGECYRTHLESGHTRSVSATCVWQVSARVWKVAACLYFHVFCCLSLVKSLFIGAGTGVSVLGRQADTGFVSTNQLY